jgi:hypothetical protein
MRVNRGRTFESWPGHSSQRSLALALFHLPPGHSRRLGSRAMRLRRLGIPKLWQEEPEILWYPLRWFVATGILGVLAPGSRGYGLDRVPLSGGAVLAANHFASLDHPLIGIFSPSDHLLHGEGRAARDAGRGRGPELDWSVPGAPLGGRSRCPPRGSPSRAGGGTSWASTSRHQAAARLSGAGQDRGGDGRDAGRRSGDPMRGRDLPLVGEREPCLCRRLRRHDQPGRSATKPGRLPGSDRSRRKRDHPPLAPGGRSGRGRVPEAALRRHEALLPLPVSDSHGRRPIPG